MKAAEADKLKTQSEQEKAKVEKDLQEMPLDDAADRKETSLDSSLETDENMDTNEIIDVGGRPLVAENVKTPLVDQSNLHRDIPTDLSRLAPPVTQQSQHPINARM